MGKRSSFDRVPRDFYPTPHKAVLPLLPHLPPRTVFAEPCAGDGRLVGHLETHGHVCAHQSDYESPAEGVLLPHVDMVITNPPWRRDVLHPIIWNLATQTPTWLLFDADWMHTKQAEPLLPMLRQIVSVGRVRWIEGSTMDGKDNCCWYRFGFGREACFFTGRIDGAVKARHDSRP